MHHLLICNRYPRLYHKCREKTFSEIEKMMMSMQHSKNEMKREFTKDSNSLNKFDEISFKEVEFNTTKHESSFKESLMKSKSGLKNQLKLSFHDWTKHNTTSLNYTPAYTKRKPKSSHKTKHSSIDARGKCKLILISS